MNEDIAEERNEGTDKQTYKETYKETDEAGLFLSSTGTATSTLRRTFHRLSHAVQDDTITTDQVYAEAGRDPHRAGNRQWLYLRMREFRYYGLVKTIYNPTYGPERMRVKGFRLTAKGKQILERYEAGLKDKVERSGKTVTQEASQEASEAQTVPAPSPLAPKKWVPPEKEALTFDSAVLFLIEWQRENPSFGLTVESIVKGAVALEVRLKGKGQK